MSGFLAAGFPAGSAVPSSPPAAPPTPPTPPGGAGDPSRNGGLLLLAGIGLLLLAMGIGVLIGRSSAKSSPGPAQVVTIGSSATAPTSSGEEASFSDDWPSGTKGYTVQLQTLPKSGTTKAAVEQAKSAATGKGASSVGALLSDHFSSLGAGSYIIYSGVYHKRAEAEKALKGLQSKFPGAKVIAVTEGGSGGGTGGSSKESSEAGSGSGAGSNLSHPAPPSALEGLKKARGKSYVEKSKNLPNVVSTG